MRGVYLLFLRVVKDFDVRVGGLGSINFERGLYVYVGSAQNNLEKRVLRHRTREKKLRWHIDYLTASENVKVIAAYAYPLPKKYECIIARKLSEICLRSIKGFGTSDCRCVSHLFRTAGDLENVCKRISESIRGEPRRVF